MRYEDVHIAAQVVSDKAEITMSGAENDESVAEVLKRLKKEMKSEGNAEKLKVDEEDLAVDFFQYYKNNNFDPKTPIKVQLRGQPGIDSGGILRQAFSTIFALLARNEFLGLRLFTGPVCRLTPVYSSECILTGVFEIIGRMISHSLIQNGPGFPYFTPAVYSYIATGNLEEAITKVSVIDIADPDLVEFVGKIKDAPAAMISEVISEVANQPSFIYLLQECGETRTLTQNNRDAITFKRERYEIKSSTTNNYKKVPHEELDFGIYKKHNLVAFQTTELRLPLWIEAVYHRYYRNEIFNDINNELETKWTEQNDASNTSKCEEISIEILHKNENVLTITIFVTKGRIQIQGRFTKAWANDEFDHVRAIVNNDEEANENTKVFSNRILKRKDTSQSTTSAPDNNSTDVNFETDNFSGEKSFSMLKNIIANLESEFVTYKIDANTKLEELYKTLEKKDNEIAMLKQEITNLKTINNNQQQTLSDLSLKQLEIEESIEHLQSEHKNEREKSKKLAVKEIAAAKSTSPDKETQPPPTHTILNCIIPTANRFEP
ncbi:G2 M phase-specific E3 ubiquitin- ligase-like [Paramuricea clavata]|uniref:G2 M phase-specific E3 ubiquitin- ligase-like n=1 Tax=Paramuricea clavata TaxID=317549 RepID=A0A7D9I641_PARCT|nr:G2 M phase-specific E3 ubiquitin- ligase-like [Paramuricea clavata]